MVRNYKRKTTRGNIPLDVHDRAVQAVLDGGKVAVVAKDFDIPRVTLIRNVMKRRNNVGTIGYEAVRINKMILSSQMEVELADHLKLLANMFHGLTLMKCRELAYEFAIQNDAQIPESWTRNKKAGQEWCKSFRVRQRLSIRSPEATSFARATAFNKPNVGKFFDNLASVIDKHDFEPHQILNMDETGVTTVQTPKAVIAATGQKQVGSITSAERGSLVTLIYSMSASGNLVPPMFVFPRVNFRDHMMNGAPPSSVGRATASGWSNEDIFIDYLHHFIAHVKCSPTNKVLLILDNHDSHATLEAVDLAKSNGIVLLTLPPHTSHRLQPLDVAVFGPFKTCFNHAMDGFLRSNPGRTVTIYEVAILVCSAQLKAMTPTNAIAGFRSTGICPYDRDIFSDCDFLPAQTTDQPMDVEQNEEEECEAPIDLVVEKASTSKEGTAYVSPAMIHPVPKAQPRKKRAGGRKKGSTKILTDTPVRNMIASESQVRAEKKVKKACMPKKTYKKKLFTKAVRGKSDSESDADPDECLLASESEYSDDDMTEVMEGDFLVVKVDGKKSSSNYLIRIDVVDVAGLKDVHEGFFLKKMSGDIDADTAIFAADEEDCGRIQKGDILAKLMVPEVKGGSARCCALLVFKCKLSRWNLRY